MFADNASDAHHLLVIYLQDHLAASSGGRAVAQRLAKANSGTDLGRCLDAIVSEIDTERTALRTLIEQQGPQPTKVRAAIMRMGAAVGAWKPNGRLVRRSPLSNVIEMEALIGGIDAKERMWRALSALYGPDVAPIPDWSYGALGELAVSQRERLLPHHLRATREAFGAAVPTPAATGAPAEGEAQADAQ